MRIASFNVNGINARLSALLLWLSETSPDIVCLQELKAPTERFPAAAIRAAGYHAIWHGQKSWNGVAILAKGTQPVERVRVLPGDPDDQHSRYIEAEIDGLIVGCLYLPNGNPAPGPKFSYKLRWFERLQAHAAALLESGLPAASRGAVACVFAPSADNRARQYFPSFPGIDHESRETASRRYSSHRRSARLRPI
jgi:exodeoxyribonuclease III